MEFDVDELDVCLEEAHTELSEESAGPSGKKSSTLTTSLKKIVPCGTKDLPCIVEQVLQKLKSDPILLLSPDISLHLSKLQLNDTLIKCVEPLVHCMPSVAFIPSFKTKSWQAFYKLKDSIIPSITTIVNHQPLASFIGLHVMEELLIMSLKSIETTSNSSTPNTVDDAEKEIIAYVAGFILFRCQRILSSDAGCLSVVRKCIDSDGSFNKLITIKNRGGLCFPSDESVKFFSACECVFRDQFSVVYCSLSSFISAVCSHEEIVHTFLTCTACDVVEDTSDQEVVMLNFLKLFFKVRTNAKCRKLMDLYYAKTKKSNKPKALRKSLPSS